MGLGAMMVASMAKFWMDTSTMVKPMRHSYREGADWQRRSSSFLGRHYVILRPTSLYDFRVELRILILNLTEVKLTLPFAPSLINHQYHLQNRGAFN